jgi:hypothetical protein
MQDAWVVGLSRRVDDNNYHYFKFNNVYNYDDYM